MIVARTIREAREARSKLGAVGFVPTMGAFHAGHLALMKAAKAEQGMCVASLFVNPTQFAPGEDLSKYPRQEERDFAMAEESGVDLMFAPAPEEIYRGGTTRVAAGSAAEGWEGAKRPGHFDGVATVVSKLFLIVQPESVWFGRKDLQQCAVVRQMVEDLNFPISLRFLETVREPDGLAMSSRNAYFSEDDRAQAARFPEILLATTAKLRSGAGSKSALSSAVRQLKKAGFEVDYCSVVDPWTMQETTPKADEARLMAAIRWKGVRLLDNMPID